MKPRAPDDLPALRASIWRELEAAAHTREHGWRHPVLATAGADGADARTVVLRDVDAAHGRIVIYSDSRSPKVAQLRADPRATLVAWCAERSWQLRVVLAVEVADSGLDVSSRWARLKLTPAAQDYLSPLPPGTPMSTTQAHATPERSTREHFCVLWGQVLVIDWLELHADGHRRARFDAAGARWLAP
jgi:pyridoxamine 5'-phosphate oxidase